MLAMLAMLAVLAVLAGISRVGASEHLTPSPSPARRGGRGSTDIGCMSDRIGAQRLKIPYPAAFVAWCLCGIIGYLIAAISGTA